MADRAEIRAGRYTLKQKLGAGGMGEVWLASDEGPHGYRKTVVIKNMLPEAARFLDYFTNEAKLGARLTHQNIVQVIDFFVEGDKYNIVMEYVEGASVEELQERQQLSPEQAVCVAVQALKGLEFAHNATIDGQPAKIVHRDLSPDNLLVSCDAEVKVTDFGIAKASVAWRKETQVGFKGKWGYISPEALLGQDVDRRADVYAMGVVLYEMLSHRRAFPPSSSQYHQTAKIVEGQIEPLATVAPQVPRSLVEIVEAMMRPARDQRMQTAGEARDALMRALPTFVQGEKSLAEMVRRFSAKKRRWTSPFLRDDERAAMAMQAPQPSSGGGVIMSAHADQETVKNAEPAAPQQLEREDSAPRLVLDVAKTVRLDERRETPPGVRRGRVVRRRRGWLWIALFVGGAGLATTATAVIVGRHESAPATSAVPPPTLTPATPAPPPASAPAAAAPAAAPATARTAPPAEKHSVSSAQPSHRQAAHARGADDAQPSHTAEPEQPHAAEPPPARAPVEDTPGSIVVHRSASPIKVVVDGVSIGTAPLKYDVGPGDHEVVLVETASHTKVGRRVHVASGQEVVIEGPATSAPADAFKLWEATQAAYVKEDFAGAAARAQECISAATDVDLKDKAQRLLIASVCALKDADRARELFRTIQNSASYVRYVCTKRGVPLP